MNGINWVLMLWLCSVDGRINQHGVNLTQAYVYYDWFHSGRCIIDCDCFLGTVILVALHNLLSLKRVNRLIVKKMYFF